MFFESYMSIENIKITKDITLITLLMSQITFYSRKFAEPVFYEFYIY